MSPRLPSRREIEALARAAAAKHGLDPGMFVAQLAQESDSFAPDVLTGKRKSGKGAIGVAQFMPKTAKDEGVDPLNIPQAIEGAARYMARLVKQFGSEDLARQAYNWGMGNLSKHLKNPKAHPMPPETREYNALIAQRAGPRDDMGIPVLGSTPTAQVMQIMKGAPKPPAAAAGSPGLFSAAAAPMTTAQPAAMATPPSMPADGGALFAGVGQDMEPQQDVALTDIFDRATASTGSLFPTQPSFPDSFDGMIRQLLKRV